VQASVALKRIDKFMNSDELKNQVSLQLDYFELAGCEKIYLITIEQFFERIFAPTGKLGATLARTVFTPRRKVGA
jgi:hypothetical protein